MNTAHLNWIDGVWITGADVKPLKSGKGTGLSLEFTVIDPAQHAKRKVWQNLNIQHDNAQAGLLLDDAVAWSSAVRASSCTDDSYRNISSTAPGSSERSSRSRRCSAQLAARAFCCWNIS